jgi:hypothetical protein
MTAIKGSSASCSEGTAVPCGNEAAVDRLDEPSDATIRNPAATSAAAAELGAR